MEFFKAVEERHSYRGGYETTAVPESDIVKLLDAAIRAPSGCNAQTTKFIVVLNPTLREGIAKLFKSETVSTAPVIIVATTSKLTFDFGLDFELEDYAAAVEHILLGATAMGYASRWIDGDTRLGGKDAAIAKLLGVPADMAVRAVLPIGVPKEPGKQAPRKSHEERVIWKR